MTQQHRFFFFNPPPCIESIQLLGTAALLQVSGVGVAGAAPAVSGDVEVAGSKPSVEVAGSTPSVQVDASLPKAQGMEMERKINLGLFVDSAPPS